VKNLFSLRRLLVVAASFAVLSASAGTWTPEDITRWYRAQPWLVGANFVPKDAENPLEMWQAGTFNLPEIDRELGYAERLGMNTVRVFLHDLLWQTDRVGFERRLDAFLDVASRHHIRPLLVLFDSCWDPAPVAGVQPPPRVGVHNSRWVQSPGIAALANPNEYPRLEMYVRGIVSAFARDPRILAWDVWNEPDNLNTGTYNDTPAKMGYVETLLPRVFEWARSSGPIQPLTSGVWNGDWSSDRSLRKVEQIQLGLSDFITFHNYGGPDDFAQRVSWLERFHRPIVTTEYMARPLGSTFQAILPVAHAHAVGAINWGFVAGKTQTYFPWDSWQKPYPKSGPPLWFHDIFYADGTPYLAAEANFIQSWLRHFNGMPLAR
jgi:hypothetical protein